MLFQNTTDSHVILDEWAKYPTLPKSKCYGKRNNNLHDQNGINDYVLFKFANKIKLVKNYYLLNGMYGYFVRHILGPVRRNREQEFKRIFESPLMNRNRELLKRVNTG